MFIQSRRDLRISLLCAILLIILMSRALSQNNDTAEVAIKEFNERVEKYMEIHKLVQKSLPPLIEASHPELIVPRQEKLGEAIRQVRSTAKQGQVFTSTVQPIFLSIIKTELTGPTGKEARASILGEENPKAPASPVKFKLAVNATYPATAPRTTVPPFLLLRLPELPQGLEYRFVGRDLILLDTKANLIVDILPRAVS